MALSNKYQVTVAKLFNHSAAGLCWKQKVRPDSQVKIDNCPVYFNVPYTKLQISLRAWRSL